MKKAYFTPKTMIVEMRLEPVMGITSTSEKQADQGASNYSRQSSDWEDE